MNDVITQPTLTDASEDGEGTSELTELELVRSELERAHARITELESLIASHSHEGYSRDGHTHDATGPETEAVTVETDTGPTEQHWYWRSING